jgi:fluoroquinolone resistance protein
MTNEIVAFDFDDAESEYFSKNFREIDFSNQEITSREFEECHFTECNFSDAIFKDCKLIDCTFAKCNFSNVKLAHSRFVGVNFDECKVIGVDWTRATWSNFSLPAPLKFSQCIINDSSFMGLDLAEIVIEHCKAHDVDFRDGTFIEANFTYTDFSNSLFSNSNLSSVDFSEASNYDIDIHSNIIKGAKFSSHEAVRLLNSLEIELVD